MEKIEDGEFQAMQFYLKSADRERLAEKQEVSHTLNLSEIISSANARIIEHQAEALPSAREDIDIKQLNKAKNSWELAHGVFIFSLVLPYAHERTKL